MSEIWGEATGDSYVVNAQKVVGAGGAAEYIGKYLEKSFLVRSRMEKRGFNRRFSRSRNWPVEKLQLAITKEKGWSMVDFAYAGRAGGRFLRKRLERQPEEMDELERVGTDLILTLEEKASRKRLRKVGDRVLTNIQKDVGPGVGGRELRQGVGGSVNSRRR